MTTKAEKRVQILARRDALRKSRKAEKAKQWAEWLKFCEDNPSPKLLHTVRVRYRTGKQILAGLLPERTLVRCGMLTDSGMDDGGIEAMQAVITKHHTEMHQMNERITAAWQAEHKEKNHKLELTIINA